MTDEKLIYNFLYKNFIPIFYNKKIGVFDKLNKKNLTSEEFRFVFSHIFNDYLTDNNETPYDIGAKWFKCEKKKLIEKLDNYLEKCDVILGDTTWHAIGADGTELTDKIILETFDTEYDEEFLLEHFDSWFFDKMVDKTENIFNKW